MPVDFLKVDRALVAGPRACAVPMLQAVVEVGRRLGAEVVATGLEDPAHLDLARSAGCRFGQGFLLAAPGHAEHVEAFLDNHRTRMF
jgi:EAL domain-containing protein (putative c-di-GMP-specific phosphodiesterase class I)